MKYVFRKNLWLRYFWDINGGSTSLTDIPFVWLSRWLKERG